MMICCAANVRYRMVGVATCLLGMIFGQGCATGSGSQSGLGAIRARVEARAALAGQRGELTEYSSAGPSSDDPRFVRRDYAAVPDIVVWAAPLGGQAVVAAAPPFEISFDAARSTADPIQGVGVGRQLVIRNSGSRSATIYSVSEGNEFNAGSIAPGTSTQFVVRNAGLIEILATPGGATIAQLYAAPSPWVQVAGSGERIMFRDLPPGRYEIGSWHANLPGKPQTVSVSGGSTQDVTVIVGVDALPRY